ncbi:D-2-hydroxyacid dehydrogenase family protein [Bordetella sp. BOR01]|uniref:D-2-hydroxyacid dehydrogenase family protein n=1 Tax=Bordetella sp. BOR01 TaxID=2854779 RepID=UPI001C46F8D0|nr:D-2-hydroxyacid dehydrogenase family protein [Bordetella sp. BOR01]MBV7486597.1 D-2-hydroxyacid dehydrogenase family protein [Bordetella sp. BOR01]
MSGKPRIVVLDDWENGLRTLVDWSAIGLQAELDIHARALTGADLLAALRPATCVVLMRDRTPMTGELMRQLPGLRHIVFTGTRNKKLDLQTAADLGIQVSHTDWGPSKASTCEMTWALILAAVRHLPSIALTPARTLWRDAGATPLLPAVLQGERLGLIGLGQIGARVAAVGKALGMEVVAWSPHMTMERAAQHGVQAVALDELLSTSRVVSLHLVPADGTRGLLDRERLALMRADSLLVNTSRAELVDMDAVVQALRAGRPGFGAFDVYDTEPLPAGHALLSLPNVLLTPHYGFVSAPVYREFAMGVQRNLLAWLAGEAVPNTLAAA